MRRANTNLPALLLIAHLCICDGNEEQTKFDKLQIDVSRELVKLHTKFSNEVRKIKSDLSAALLGFGEMKQEQSKMQATINRLELIVNRLSKNDSRPKHSHDESVLAQNPIEGAIESADYRCNLDILFVIDGSGSVGHENFALVKNWIKSVSEEIKMEIPHVSFGVMQYSHKFSRKKLREQPYIKTYIRIGEFVDQNEFSDAIDNISLHGFTTYTGAALRKAKLDFENSQNFNKSDVNQILILITDGLSSDWRTVKRSAMKLRQSGVIPFAIGIAGAYEQELRIIANGNANDSSRVFMLNDFKQLSDVNTAVKRNVMTLGNECRQDEEKSTLDSSTATMMVTETTSLNESDEEKGPSKIGNLVLHYTTTVVTNPSTTAPSEASYGLSQTITDDCNHIGGFTYLGDCIWLIYDRTESLTFDKAKKTCSRINGAKLADISSIDQYHEVVSYLEMKSMDGKWDWVMAWTAMVGDHKTQEVNLSYGKKAPYASPLLRSGIQLQGNYGRSHMSLFVLASSNPPMNGLQQSDHEQQLSGALCQLLRQ